VVKDSVLIIPSVKKEYTRAIVVSIHWVMKGHAHEHKVQAKDELYVQLTSQSIARLLIANAKVHPAKNCGHRAKSQVVEMPRTVKELVDSTVIPRTVIPAGE
jgi:hypothetical protein